MAVGRCGSKQTQVKCSSYSNSPAIHILFERAKDDGLPSKPANSDAYSIRDFFLLRICGFLITGAKIPAAAF